jgi:hypothetical protein
MVTRRRLVGGSQGGDAKGWRNGENGENGVVEEEAGHGTVAFFLLAPTGVIGGFLFAFFFVVFVLFLSGLG